MLKIQKYFDLNLPFKHKSSFKNNNDKSVSSYIDQLFWCFVKFNTKELNKFRINSVNAAWCNIQSFINCKSLLTIENAKT
ncbi:hypothetical protein BpHYR1_004283 [Brachionus plicatilis]|uniref:Uncharacterized protein n=1 Tax=Brachionus plicatilis TaxID=10195 RepID=A0A3M7PBK6_BRAPC|nr:hypothetical protein BpHYR1_004283 [Brachionus plicatilis]